MTLTTSSLKGGVGKTTLSIFLAQALRSMGQSVLSIDLDHNNNLTDYWLREGDASKIEDRNIRHVLTGKQRLEDAIWRLVDMDIIPATPSLATIGIELANNPMRILALRAGLRKLDYDYILIDTPPALTIELTAGLYAADVVLVPVSASRWTVQGYQVIEGEVARVEDAGLPIPRMLALPSMVTEVQARVLQDSSHWTATRTAIYRDAPIQAAASEGRALREGTRAARWFDELAQEATE